MVSSRYLDDIALCLYNDLLFSWKLTPADIEAQAQECSFICGAEFQLREVFAARVVRNSRRDMEALTCGSGLGILKPSGRIDTLVLLRFTKLTCHFVLLDSFASQSFIEVTVFKSWPKLILFEWNLNRIFKTIASGIKCVLVRILVIIKLLSELLHTVCTWYQARQQGANDYMYSRTSLSDHSRTVSSPVAISSLQGLF